MAILLHFGTNSVTTMKTRAICLDNVIQIFSKIAMCRLNLARNRIKCPVDFTNWLRRFSCLVHRIGLQDPGVQITAGTIKTFPRSEVKRAEHQQGGMEHFH